MGRRRVVKGVYNRIIVATQDRISPPRGGGLRTRKVAIEFAKRGENVIIMAPSDKNYLSGIKVIRLFGLSGKRSPIIDSALFVFQLFFLLIPRLTKVNLFFVHNSVAALPVLFWAKIFRKKVILDITDLSTEYLLANAKGRLKRCTVKLLMFLEYTTGKLSDTVIVVTQAMKEHLVKKGIKEDKMYVVYDGAEVKGLMSDVRMGRQRRIIHHGGIDERDGLIDLVEATPYILKKCTGVKIYILGGGSCLNDIRKRVEELGISGNFVFTGWLPYQDVKKYLSDADIGVITRIPILPNHLVLTLKLLEYWASATAVCSSRLKGIEEVSNEGANIIFYNSGNYKELAKAIIKMFEDSDRLKKLKKNGMRTVRRYDWDNLIPTIVDMSLKGKI